MQGGELLNMAWSVLGKALEKTRDAAVLVVEKDSVMTKYAESQVSVVQRWRSFSVSLYMNREGRVFVLGFESPSLEEAARKVIDFTESYKIMEESEYNAPLPEPENPGVLEGCFDASIRELLEKEKERETDEPTEVIRSVIENHVVDRFAGKVSCGVLRKALVTSKGFEAAFEKTFFDGYIRVFKGENSGQWAFTSTRYDKEMLRSAVEKACCYAELKLPFTKVEPGKYKIALSPMVAGNLFDYIADQASAMSIDMGASFLIKYKVGDKIASEKLTLLDRPRDPLLPGVSPFDDEGLRTYDKPVIEDGVLKNILHNTKTAAKRKTKSTANAGWLTPHAWNLEVKPGDLSEEELFSEIKKGLVITNNWYTRLQNYVEGQFSTVSRDAVIVVENGEPVALARRIRVADTFPSLLQNITGMTRNRYQIEWWEVETPIRLPFIVVEQAGITSTD